MNLDNPKLTAYALGELDEPERSTIADAIADSPEAQHFVVETQQLARGLRARYRLELQRDSIAPTEFIAVADDSFWSKAGPLAIAAVLALFALIGAIALSTNRSGSAPTLPVAGQFAAVEAEEGTQRNVSPEPDTVASAYTGEHPFISVLRNPHSSFSIIVNPASYSEIRRSIDAGVLPPKDTVRIEQMINYFNYDYPEPAADEPVSINIDIASCPWAESHQLLRIGLKGRDAPSDANRANIIAGEAKIDVEFNPARIESYRLIGYDTRLLRRESPNGEGVRAARIVPGYTVTALYEVVLVAQPGVRLESRAAGVVRQEAETLLSAKLQYKKPGNDKVEIIERSITHNGVDFAAAHQDLKFAAAVAEFGMILRDSEYKGNATLSAVLQWAQEGTGSDANGYRAGFIELVRKAQALKGG
jgi:hypothetical protein